VPHVHAAAHDLLVARYVDRDVDPTEEAEARRLIETCDVCAVLERDLRAIAAAVPDGMPVWATVQHRDFRLTPGQAAELRRSRPERAVRRWVEGLRMRRLTLLQPLAGATVALGLVMAVLSSPAMATLNPTPVQDAMLAPAAVPAPEAAAPGDAAPVGGAAPKLGDAGASTSGTAPTEPMVGAGGQAAAGNDQGASDSGQSAAGGGTAASGGTISSPIPSPVTGLPTTPAADASSQPSPATSPPLALALPPAAAGPTVGDAGDQRAGVPADARASIAAETEAANAEPGSVSAPYGDSTRDAGSVGASLPVEPWAAWLIVAAAGAVVLVALRLRRPRSGTA
jgi:hypothetical protein